MCFILQLFEIFFWTHLYFCEEVVFCFVVFFLHPGFTFHFHYNLYICILQLCVSDLSLFSRVPFHLSVSSFSYLTVLDVFMPLLFYRSLPFTLFPN